MGIPAWREPAPGGWTRVDSKRQLERFAPTADRWRMKCEPPPRNPTTVNGIRLAELTRAKRRFLINHDDQMEQCEYGCRILSDLEAGEEPGLANEQEHDSVVHRIAGEPVRSTNDQFPRRIDGRSVPWPTVANCQTHERSTPAPRLTRPSAASDESVVVGMFQRSVARRIRKGT